MSSSMVYEQVYELLDQHLDEQVDKDTRERLTLLVLGIIQSESAGSRIALSGRSLSD